MDPDQVAKAFVEHYYSTFDANRAGLANLYQDGSMLTFEGQKTQGSQNIVAKLIALPFQQCKHLITTVDCQPSGPAGGMLVFVSGNLQLAGEQHALKFSQIANAACGLFSIQKNLWRSAPPAHQNIEIWPYGQGNMMLPRHFWILSVHSSPVQQQLTRKEAGLARILDEST
ncbi:hypothetical protein NC652_000703 [Populus alba x Populus x berolinensis]|nr:hypothetical protein NC652_000703 [Populus alba x Populus x berolinensis]